MMLGFAFAAALASAPVHLGPSLPRARSVERRAAPAAVPSMYPIATVGLSPKARNPAKLTLKLPLGRPICVLGSDPYSLAWLRSNALVLSQGGALCYIVQLDSAATLYRMRQLAPRVSLAPISGAVFVQAGLRGYPALITQSGAIK
jgi:integrating conjugative element protein (TIGR03765 family)